VIWYAFPDFAVVTSTDTSKTIGVTITGTVTAIVSVGSCFIEQMEVSISRFARK